MFTKSGKAPTGKIEAVGTLEPKNPGEKTASIEDLRKTVAEKVTFKPTGEGQKHEQ